MAFNEKYVTVTGGGLHDGSSEANAWTLAEAVSNYAAGDRLNVKAGTYTVATTVTFGTSGTASSPIAWRGYKATIGDLDTQPTTQRVAGTDVPLFTSTNTSTAAFANSGSYQRFENLFFRSVTANNTFSLNSYDYIHFVRCTIEHTNAGPWRCIFGDAAEYITFVDCYFKHNGSTHECVYAYAQSGQWNFTRCVFDGGTKGFTGTWGTMWHFFNKCLFINNSTIGLELGAHGVVTDCSFYNSGTDCISSSHATTTATISNCVFSTAGGYAINNANGTNLYRWSLESNTYHDFSFGSGRLNNIDIDRTPKVDTASPFVDAANGDFTIATTSNGYNNQYLLEKSDISSYMDGGAVQRVSIVDPTTSESTGTQIYPFRQWAQQDPELIIHPLRSN